MSLIKKIYFLLIILVGILSSCNNSKNSTTDYLFCSAENVYNDSVFMAENNSSIYLGGLKLLSDDISRTGNYSLKLDSIHRFAFTTKQKLTPNVMYELSFWQYGDYEKSLAIVQQDTNLYLKSSTIIDKDSSGWYKKSLIFTIPENLKDKNIQLYVWNASNGEVYIDDFTLKTFSFEDLGLADTLFWIYLDNPEIEKLHQNRELAQQQGVLTTTDESWVKGMVIWADEQFKVKLRLKGDWLDHLKGKKWSFRIKIRKNKAYRGMKVFSVQNPSTRHFLDQWFLYTLFRSEDLLAPRYGFVYGQLNDDFLGLYAYEEHFQKQLVESLKRREGAILKFSEESFWDVIIAHKKFDKWYNYPLYEASKIQPFSDGKTVENPTLFAGFKIAQNLVYQHKNGLANISELFDVKKAAQFFALNDVMQGYHGFRWHNQRYYYNPITSKLEFVVYDNYVGDGIYNIGRNNIMGNRKNLKLVDAKPETTVNLYLYKDSIFVDYYIKYLTKYSQKTFWDSVFIAYDQEIAYYQTILLREYPNSSFDKNLYYNHAQQILEEIPLYVKRVNNGMYDSLILPTRANTFYKETPNSYFIKSYVNIYTQSSVEDTLKLRAVNFYPENLSIIKYGNENGKFSTPKISLNSYVVGDNKTDFDISDNVDYVVVTDDTVEIEVPVMKWPEPTAWSPRQELFAKNTFPNQKYYSLVDDTVYFSGNHVCNEIILIPEHFAVVFKAGTTIDFINKGGFLSYSPVFVKGTQNSKVTIKSSDNTANGFTVLQAGKVEMNYAVFDGLNTFNYKGWGLTGAVSIYESNTTITNCEFINNVCEDDLNIVRSYFDVSNCLLQNTYSDAFDSDFCTGIVSNCTFIDLGNDAIDFSTSEIEIVNCKIYNANDKGISGGEASKLTIKDCVVDGAVIGIASKDNSVLWVDNANIKNVEYVLTAFMKKPEYGAAKIFANNVQAEKYVQISLIEENSLLILDGLRLDGQLKDVADMFY